MSVTKRVKGTENRKAISQLKAIIKKIENGEMDAIMVGGWSGIEGKMNYKIELRESRITRLYEELKKK